jgi:hypothetical protein
MLAGSGSVASAAVMKSVCYLRQLDSGEGRLTDFG